MIAKYASFSKHNFLCFYVGISVRDRTGIRLGIEIGIDRLTFLLHSAKDIFTYPHLSISEAHEVFELSRQNKSANISIYQLYIQFHAK